MSATNAFELALIDHILKNSDIANIGDATGLRGAVTAGDLYISLHTADPGETGTQSTNEAAYTGYARVAVPRSAAGWTTGSGTFSNTGAVTFPACTGGAATVTHFGIGVAASGASMLLFKGPLGASLAISNGITPAFNAGAIAGTVD